jgi:glycerophosphoryl diester phosphodiesterase
VADSQPVTADALLLVAHRAGNDLRRLAAAEQARADLVEADVHVRRGRLEVRHLKAAWPLPLLWDRWYVVDGRGPRLLLDDVLDAAAPGTRFLLDLKGPSPRLGRLVARAILAHGPERIMVCSRTWSHLRAIPAGVTTIRSLGSRSQLARFARLRAPGAGVAVNARLLDAATVANLRRTAPRLLAWGVPDAAAAHRLLSLGVNGLILDDLELLQRLRHHA